MRLGRFQLEERVFLGRVEENAVYEIKGDILGEYAETDKVHDIGELKFLPPIDPPNVICIGLNYRSHAAESNMKLPQRPEVFFKLTTAVSAHEECIALPKIAPRMVDNEAELCAVIGKTAKDIEPEEALLHCLGFTCSNDISARDCQLKLDNQWARGKSLDGFCPIGPWIETELDVSDLEVEGLLNGVPMQKSSTANMIFTIAQIISYCSKNFTLLPGTLILTGTPEGVGYARKPPVFVKPGDVYEVRIKGIGTLRNRFAG
ncbi:MAG: fumarylacetoacetate hydrolase family protein [Clostridiales bacterium]|jgi:2-keto-4-pentenoate hydratase/2-oxohepta-3-ene-1,7-dioic acid hydratase in catechol pathway|nr:fumarylacetoacetate hydrolase family protein [Clostridiales bacterium]